MLNNVKIVLIEWTSYDCIVTVAHVTTLPVASASCYAYYEYRIQ